MQFKKKTVLFVALLLAFILSISPIYGETTLLPMFNKDDFSCWFNLCSFPDYILTSFDMKNANNSLYLNGYPSSYYLNETYICSGNVTNESEPSFNGNWSNISSWLYNQTNPAISWVQAQNYLTSFNEQDPYYFLNPSNYYNFTTMPYYNNLSISDINTSSYYQIKINHSNILNMPSFLLMESEPNFNSNYSYINSKPNNTFNSTYDYITLNLTNNSLNLNYMPSWYYWNQTGNIPITNITFSSNFNITSKNMTFQLSSESVPSCSLYYNSTGSMKFCDCFNSTHKWVSNSC